MKPPHIQQNKCCEKCKCNNLTKDHQFVRGIHTCDNSSCPCHSTPTQQKCEVCNDDPLFSCTVCSRQATETHTKHYKSEDFRQVVSPTQPEWMNNFEDFYWERGEYTGRKLGIQEYKDFIESTIQKEIERERSQLLQEIEERVTEYVQEAIKDPQSDNYIYAKYIPLSRLSAIINSFK